MSMTDTTTGYGISLRCTSMPTNREEMGCGGWAPGTAHYKVTLRRSNPRRQITALYSMGPALCSEPEAGEVLGCLISDAHAGDQQFEDFCGNFGHDEDSRKAEATWKDCKRQSVEIERFLGDDREAVEAAIHGAGL